MSETVKCTALKPFFWAGKNIEKGGEVEMSRHDAKWMIGRKAVIEGAPESEAKKTAAKKPAKS